MSRFHELRIADVTRETRDAVSLAFEVPEALGDAFRFRAGQHLALRTRIDGEEVVRTYSICVGEPTGELRVAVKHQPGGRFSSYANERLAAGQLLEVMEPMGHFNAVVDPARPRHHVAFAAGSGITPIISILETVLAREPHSRFTLVYANRNTGSMIFRERLEDIKNRHMERFNLISIMSREQPEIELFHGRIDGAKCDALLQHWIDAAQIDECYVCGPEPMTEAVLGSLRQHGVAPARLHHELFTVPGEAQRRQQARREATGVDHSATRVTVVVDGRRTRFELPRNSASILEAGLEAGADLPFSCKGGVCATCRAKLISGEVDMDVNYALEDYELDAGYVLTCQSFPLSAEVELSYDD
ncbi:MAG TPA: 1,2-phenylacetyl-CoA epoxidase subunit PaaE [Gammaproteobacteria bacterium]|nr:1,2-phenylacetyl-CoA epoxidase subunit PaaE [Gammaproteobacteria bacterium]